MNRESNSAEKKEKQPQYEGIEQKSARRTILKTVGSGVVGVSMINIVGAANDKVEVVMEWYGSEPYVTREVPQHWYDWLQKVNRIHDDLEKEYEEDEDVFDLRVIKGKKTKGGKLVNRLEAVVRSGSGAGERIPDERDGVPIEIKEVKNNSMKLLTHYGCANNKIYDYLWGGIHIVTTTDGDNDPDKNGTVCCPVKRNGNPYAFTANHLFNPSIDNCTANWEDKAWQHDYEDNRYIGDVNKYDQAMDYAIIKLQNMDPIYDVKNARWGGGMVSHASETRLAEMINNNITVEQMGVKTGSTLGEIESKSVDVDNGCISFDNNGIKCSADVGQGDSGGPVYAESESGDGITMCGLVSGTRNWLANGTACDGSDTYTSFFGPPAYHAANKYDLTFSY